LVEGVVIPLLATSCCVSVEEDTLKWRAGEGEAPGHRCQGLLRLVAQHLFNLDEELIKVRDG
jgi:hypothetical protein